MDIEKLAQKILKELLPGGYTRMDYENITRHLTAAWKERDEKVRSLVSRAQREMGMVPPEQRTESDQQIYDLLCEALRELGKGGSDE